MKMPVGTAGVPALPAAGGALQGGPQRPVESSWLWLGV